MPAYAWAPSGGFRVVYEYANRLVSRGHEVTVIHPRHIKNLEFVPKLSMYHRMKNKAQSFLERFVHPTITWHSMDARVRLLYVPDSSSTYIPDGDSIFATMWTTVRPVLDYPQQKGEKFYLIQGYEDWMAPKEIIDATWRKPLRRVVVSKWLYSIGERLGCGSSTYIPNAVDHTRYRVLQGIEKRRNHIAMMYSTGNVKGSADGFQALEKVRRAFPNLRVICFGVGRRLSWVPDWVEFHRNPAQEFIINNIYNSSRIFVSPSWSEGFSLPAAEAAACGCAIVATDSGGIRDFIRDGVTGLLSPPKDSEALAKNISALLADDDLRIRFANAARERATKLDWNRSTDQLERIILECVARTCENDQPRAIQLGNVV